jgi:NAD+ synthase
VLDLTGWDGGVRVISLEISTWLQSKLQASGQKGFVVGVSGGIDSAVVSSLCANTLKPTVCLTLPIYQPPSHIVRAEEHITALKKKYGRNVSSFEVDLTLTFEALKTSLPADIRNSELTMANVRARLRMTTLYTFAGAAGLLVAGTGNKIEDYGVGFFTKYGDGGVDLSPIGDLTKTQVYAVGKYLGVPESTLKAVPTDGLWTNDRSDEDQIGATYAELEVAMEMCQALNIETKAAWHALVVRGWAPNLSLRERTVMAIYLERHEKNMHKMEMPPICRISSKTKAGQSE